MVSPGTHLVKIHESLSITNEFQFKKTRSPKLKMLGFQTVNLETDAKTLHYMYSNSIYLKHKKDCRNKYTSLNIQQPQKLHKQDIPPKDFQIDRPFHLVFPVT